MKNPITWILSQLHLFSKGCLPYGFWVLETGKNNCMSHFPECPQFQEVLACFTRLLHLLLQSAFLLLPFFFLKTCCFLSQTCWFKQSMLSSYQYMFFLLLARLLYYSLLWVLFPQPPGCSHSSVLRRKGAGRAVIPPHFLQLTRDEIERR